MVNLNYAKPGFLTLLHVISELGAQKVYFAKSDETTKEDSVGRNRKVDKARVVLIGRKIGSEVWRRLSTSRRRMNLLAR